MSINLSITSPEQSCCQPAQVLPLFCLMDVIVVLAQIAPLIIEMLHHLIAAAHVLVELHGEPTVPALRMLDAGKILDLEYGNGLSPRVRGAVVGDG